LSGSGLEPLRERRVTSLVETIYRHSERGIPTQLAAAGTTLENPFVYDSAARELKAMAHRGLVEIVNERVALGADEPLIEDITFSRLR
jgi:hypothetical protein